MMIKCWYTIAVMFLLAVCSEAKFHVFVINHIGAEADHINLTVHCQSSGQDLGPHVLEFGGAFDWQFDASKDKSLYSCEMSWKNARGRFNVFDVKRDSTRCGKDHNCYWRIDRDGLYLYIAAVDDYQLQFRWPR